MKRPPLTDRQREVLDYIVAHVKQVGYQPSIHEMMDQFGIASPNGVTCHLRALERKGYIRRGKGLARCIEILK